MVNLIEYALSFVGIAYRWGGDDPMAGYDCSGFVQEILASVGMDPPGDQTAEGLLRHFSPSGRYLFKDTMEPGALVFYGKNQATHVALGIDEFRVIEAAGGGSKTTDLPAAIRDNAFIRIRPWRYRSDFLCAIMPPYGDRL